MGRKRKGKQIGGLCRREKAIKHARKRNRRKRREGRKGSDMKGGAEGRREKRKRRQTEIDIASKANGTTYIKQIEIVYTGKDGKRMKEICGLQSEGHEMNRARGPTGVCPGNMCCWVRERSVLWELG